MLKLEQIDIDKIPSNAKLCFIGKNKELSSNKVYNDLICYFTTKDIKNEVWGKDWGKKYSCDSTPQINEDNKDEFYLVHITNFYTCENFGIEQYVYQKDYWTTIGEIRPNLTIKMVNSGFGGWLYKSNDLCKCDAEVLGSNTTFIEFMTHFGEYNNFFYKYV